MGPLPDVHLFLKNTVVDSAKAVRPFPDVHKFLRDRRQNEINIFNFMAEEQEQMFSDIRHWDCPVVHMTDKGKKHDVSGEASGSGSGKQAGYSAGHKQREDPD